MPADLQSAVFDRFTIPARRNVLSELRFAASDKSSIPPLLLPANENILIFIRGVIRKLGADSGTRTQDLLFTKQLL